MGRGASWPDRTGVPVRKGRATGPHRGRPAGQDSRRGAASEELFPFWGWGRAGPPAPAWPGRAGLPPGQRAVGTSWALETRGAGRESPRHAAASVLSLPKLHCSLWSRGSAAEGPKGGLAPG